VFTIPILAFTISDPGVHVALILAFTFSRSGRSPWAGARTYTFLRYQYWDGDAGRERYAREYVTRSDLPRVRRWIRRVRAETAFGWGQAGLLRRAFALLNQRRGLSRESSERRK
jgi:hypothetical protein